MEPTQQMALGLLELMEQQAIEIVALRSVLARESLELDWREEVETAKILCADRVHRAFGLLRAQCQPSQLETSLPSDLDSVVRRILENL